MKKLEDVAVTSWFRKEDKVDSCLWVKAIGDSFEVLKDVAAPSEHYICVKPSNEVLPDYLVHILQRPISELNDKDTKALKKLSIVQVMDIVIPVPSIAEQEQILGSSDVSQAIKDLWAANDIGFNDLLGLLLKPKKS